MHDPGAVLILGQSFHSPCRVNPAVGVENSVWDSLAAAVAVDGIAKVLLRPEKSRESDKD